MAVRRVVNVLHSSAGPARSSASFSAQAIAHAHDASASGANPSSTHPKLVPHLARQRSHHVHTPHHVSVLLLDQLQMPVARAGRAREAASAAMRTIYAAHAITSSRRADHAQATHSSLDIKRVAHVQSGARTAIRS